MGISISGPDAAAWLDGTVRVPTLSSLTLDQWIEVFVRLKKLNAEILQASLCWKSIEEEILKVPSVPPRLRVDSHAKLQGGSPPRFPLVLEASLCCRLTGSACPR